MGPLVMHHKKDQLRDTFRSRQDDRLTYIERQRSLFDLSMVIGRQLEEALVLIDLPAGP